MYTKKEDIVGIKSFSLGSTLMGLNNLNQVIEYDDKTSVLLHEFDQGMQELNFNHFHFLNSNYGQGYYFSNGIHSFEKHYILTFWKSNYAITIKDGNTHVVNLDTKEIELSIPQRSLTYLISKNLIVRKIKKTNVEICSLTTGLIQWDIDISKCIANVLSPIEIKNFIGVYKENLWVQLSSGNLIAVDIKSGEIIHRLIHTFQHNATLKSDKNNFSLPSSRNKFHLDINTGKIYGESLNGIWIIDLNNENPHFEVWDIEEELLKYNIDELSYDTTYYNGTLFFNGMKIPRWGLINLGMKKIIWVSELITITKRNDAFTQLKKIEVNGKGVYVLDSGGTLHTYQNEMKL